MPRPLRSDAAALRELTHRRSLDQLWHFTPLVNLPCVLHHDALFSIDALESRGLHVPQRDSWEADKEKGVGNAVKLSLMPYWKMLGRCMCEGVPHVLMRFPIDPIAFWEDTLFGDRNVWDNDWDNWNPDSSLEFITERIFIRHGEYKADSPPEIYVKEKLELKGQVQTIFAYLPNETRLLEACLRRLGISLPCRLYTAGEKGRPFPSTTHEEYVRSTEEKMTKIVNYLESVTIDSLNRGVEFKDD